MALFWGPNFYNLGENSCWLQLHSTVALGGDTDTDRYPVTGRTSSPDSSLYYLRIVRESGSVAAYLDESWCIFLRWTDAWVFVDEDIKQNSQGHFKPETVN